VSAPESFVHPSAVVHPKARVAEGVRIGPGCVIGENVSIGAGTTFESNVFVGGWTEIGAGNRFSSYSSIGTEPQDVGYKEEETRVRIGDRNFFREFVTVNRGTVKGGGLTRIGDDGYFMAYVHIAHDCQVGNRVIMINAATLGGHVEVGDGVMMSAFSAVHQFSRIGRTAFIGGFSVITKDVVPFCKVAGQRPVHILGPNSIGLRRIGFSGERVRRIKSLFDILFFSGLNTRQAVDRIRAEFPADEDRDEILRFIEGSKRGIVRKSSETWESDSE
jgi:UDP-N-acetylglucosamine acyltransferase